MLIQNPPPVKVDRTICQSTRACFVPPGVGLKQKRVSFSFHSRSSDGQILRINGDKIGKANGYKVLILLSLLFLMIPKL